MPWLSSCPPGRSSRWSVLRVLVDLDRADVLDHADAGDLVERLAGQLAVVHDADVDAVADARLLRPLARERGLRLGQRDPGDRDAVLARRVDRQRAPAAADVEHPLALLQRQLGADQVELGLLRRLEARPVAREERAAVGHRLVEPQREEVVRDVVVVRDRALVALDAVPAPARAQLALRHRRRLDRPHRARGGDGQPQLGGTVDRRRLEVEDRRHRLVDVVDLDRPAHVGAADAELAGRAQRVGERGGRAHVQRRATAVGRRQLGPVPERDRERPVRKGRSEFPPQRLGGAQGGHGYV